MKSILLFTCLVFSLVNALGQINRKRYTIISENLYGKLVDGSGNNLSDTLYQLPYHNDFFVVDEREDIVIIRFLPWPNSPENNKQFYNLIPLDDLPSSYRNRAVKVAGNAVAPHFRILKSDFQSKTVHRLSTMLKHGELILGVVTLPIKVRPGNKFAFEGNISLGTNIGYRKAISHYKPNYLSLIGVLALSTNNINSENTNGKITETVENIATLSPALGVVFDLNRTQIGLFYGWDFLSKANQNKFGWIYNKKPWISLGFGYSIFNTTQKVNEN